MRETPRKLRYVIALYAGVIIGTKPTKPKNKGFAVSIPNFIKANMIGIHPRPMVDEPKWSKRDASALTILVCCAMSYPHWMWTKHLLFGYIYAIILERRRARLDEEEGVVP